MRRHHHPRPAAERGRLRDGAGARGRRRGAALAGEDRPTPRHGLRAFVSPPTGGRANVRLDIEPLQPVRMFFALALALCPMNSARRVKRRGCLVLPIRRFHLRDGDDTSRLSKLTSAAVVWWQRMVLSETRGLWLFQVMRGGIQLGTVLTCIWDHDSSRCSPSTLVARGTDLSAARSG